MSISPAFGPTLRATRKGLGLTQEAAAHQVGTTQRHWSFLENGRSAPTRAMLGRIVTSLHLPAARRAALFHASGFASPYPIRTLEDAALQQILDLMSRQVLQHWPFPAFVVDRDWNFLRTNAPAETMLAAFGGMTNMHTLFLSPDFQAATTNWEQASSSFLARIQTVAERSEAVRGALNQALAAGRFDHVPRVMAGTTEVPVYVPIEVALPGGERMRFTSMHGRWVTVHDTLAEQFEVELLVPLDAPSEGVARKAFG